MFGRKKVVQQPKPSPMEAEIIKRLVRIESRLCQLMLNMGVEPQSHIDNKR